MSSQHAPDRTGRGRETRIAWEVAGEADRRKKKKSLQPSVLLMDKRVAIGMTLFLGKGAGSYPLDPCRVILEALRLLGRQIDTPIAAHLEQ